MIECILCNEGTMGWAAELIFVGFYATDSKCSPVGLYYSSPRM